MVGEKDSLQGDRWCLPRKWMDGMIGLVVLGGSEAFGTVQWIVGGEWVGGVECRFNEHDRRVFHSYVHGGD